jgi:hypothetical protein
MTGGRAPAGVRGGEVGAGDVVAGGVGVAFGVVTVAGCERGVGVAGRGLGPGRGDGALVGDGCACPQHTDSLAAPSGE